jgi:cytochrome o ubiquinol oxidase subunit IV
MSAGTHAGHAPGAHGADVPHGSLKGYLIGFGLSVVLTAAAFWLVMDHVFRSPTTTALAIMVLAVVQILVHMIYFLHLNSRAEGGWTMLALIFTLVLVAITLTGSVWVMYHLNTNMMPQMSIQDMRNMP